MTDVEAKILQAMADYGPTNKLLRVDDGTLPPGAVAHLKPMQEKGWVWLDGSGLCSMTRKGALELFRYLDDLEAEDEAFELPEKHPVLKWLAGEITMERWQLILTSLVGGMIGGALTYLMSLL